MIDVVEADLTNPKHRDAVLALTRSYARDPMGGGADLPGSVQAALVERLRAHPTTLILLAFEGSEPAGLATCFLGFSTFAAKPLVNVHDLHVAPRFQRRGVGRRLLEAVEARARALDCCKLTLEVLARNAPARALYRSFGFASGECAPEAGGDRAPDAGGDWTPDAGVTLFLEKKLG